jgi:hypothetical protein
MASGRPEGWARNLPLAANGATISGAAMTAIFYVGSDNTAIVRCDCCQRSKKIDISAYGALHSLRVNIKCGCGHITGAVLEKRRAYRKETDFKGSYIHYVNGQPKGKGLLTVKDVSKTGLKLKIAAPDAMAVGDLLKVSFHLDDPQKSLIQKKVLIRNISADSVGTEFAPTETLDKSLGFYLR